MASQWNIYEFFNSSIVVEMENALYTKANLNYDEYQISPICSLNIELNKRVTCVDECTFQT